MMASAPSPNVQPVTLTVVSLVDRKLKSPSVNASCAMLLTAATSQSSENVICCLMFVCFALWFMILPDVFGHLRIVIDVAGAPFEVVHVEF